MFITTFRYRIRPEMMPLFANLQSRCAERAQSWGATSIQYLQNRADPYQWMEVHTYGSEDAFRASQERMRQDPAAAALWNEFQATMDPGFPALVEEFIVPQLGSGKAPEAPKEGRPRVVIGPAPKSAPSAEGEADAVADDAVADDEAVDGASPESEVDESAIAENRDESDAADAPEATGGESLFGDATTAADGGGATPEAGDDAMYLDEENETADSGAEAEKYGLGDATMIPIADGVFEVTRGPSGPVEDYPSNRDDESPDDESLDSFLSDELAPDTSDPSETDGSDDDEGIDSSADLTALADRLAESAEEATHHVAAERSLSVIAPPEDEGDASGSELVDDVDLGALEEGDAEDSVDFAPGIIRDDTEDETGSELADDAEAESDESFDDSLRSNWRSS